MEEKVLLDAMGNPITKKRLEEVFSEIFKTDMKPLLELCEWEEDGEHYHCWKINAGKGEDGRQITGYTNDAGAKQIHEAMKAIIDKISKPYLEERKQLDWEKQVRKRIEDEENTYEKESGNNEKRNSEKEADNS